MGGFSGGAGGAWLGRSLRGRRAAKLVERGQVECVLRVLAGAHEGLATGWRHGTATLSFGAVDFVGTYGGVRFLRRTPVRVHVLRIAPGSRPVRAGEMLTPGFEVLSVVTPDATVEWALPRAQAEWAADLVRGRG